MFVFKITLCLAACLTITYCQNYNGPTTTPVPILKQINKQNDDGSYSFGYEGADGSFKIETKYPNGDVAGKYGYVDESGKLREVSYGASSQRGFEPQGTGIMVPPPTLNEQISNTLSEGQEDDGQYREDPKIYEDPKYNRAQGSRPAFKQYHRTVQQEPEYQPRPQPQPAPSSRFSSPIFSSFGQSQNNEYRPQSQIYHQQPQFSYQAQTPQPYQYQTNNYQNQYQNQYQPNQYQSQYQPSQYSNSQYSNSHYQNQYQPNQNYNPFFGHPAQNFDPSTGSYSINFTG